MSDISNRWVEIPGEARTLKPWFPGQNILDEVRSYIRKGGEPHLWRGHTYTSPPRDEPVEYLAEFEIPRKADDETRMAPCPCCWPDHRKYGKGMVAWFPINGFIRLMGSTCFATLNKEGHEKALVELARVKRERVEVAFLLGSGDKLVRARDVIGRAAPVAAAIDDFGRDLRCQLEKAMNMPLWQQTRNGELFVVDGETRRRYAVVKGTEILNPSQRLFAQRLQQVSQALTMIPDSLPERGHGDQLDPDPP